MMLLWAEKCMVMALSQRVGDKGKVGATVSCHSCKGELMVS